MTRGSIQLRHRKACGATGKDPRACRCSPTAYVVINSVWAKVGYLAAGWRKSDLAPFEDQLGQMRNKAAAGQSWQPRKMLRLSEYAEQWFDDLEAAARAGRVSKLTFNTYCGTWENHLAGAFGAMPVAAIDAGAIRRYADGKLAEGFAATSVNGQLTPLSAMLSDAVEAGLIVANPCRQPRRGRHGASRRTALVVDQRAEPKFLELYEARALLSATPAGYRPMVLAALTTGARRCELLALRWEHVDFARSRVAIVDQLQAGELVPCKYDSQGEVVLYSGLAAMLGPRRQAEGFVFTDPDGRPWRNDGPGREFLAAAYETAGLRRDGQLWHVLRHTFASALAHGGVRPDVIAALMRHSKKGITAGYMHLLDGAFDGVEEALEAAFGAALRVNHTSMECAVPLVLDGHRPGASELLAGSAAPVQA